MKQRCCQDRITARQCNCGPAAHRTRAAKATNKVDGQYFSVGLRCPTVETFAPPKWKMYCYFLVQQRPKNGYGEGQRVQHPLLNVADTAATSNSANVYDCSKSLYMTSQIKTFLRKHTKLHCRMHGQPYAIRRRTAYSTSTIWVAHK